MEIENEEIHYNLDQLLHDKTRHQHLTHKDTHQAEILKHFYKAILFGLGNIDEILIIGPAKAKNELVRKLEQHKESMGKVLGIESVAKMTDFELIRFEARHWTGSESEDINLTFWPTSEKWSNYNASPNFQYNRYVNDYIRWWYIFILSAFSRILIMACHHYAVGINNGQRFSRLCTFALCQHG